MKIEPIMTGLEEYFLDSTRELAEAILKEEYELASFLRDDMEEKILEIGEMLLKKKMTKLDLETLVWALSKRRDEYFDEWEELFDFPKEQRKRAI
jgi:hypothetical protein